MTFVKTLYNDWASGTFYLNQSISNFTYYRVYYYSTSAGGSYHSVDAAVSQSYVNLIANSSQQGSPNKFWADSCTLYISGTTAVLGNYYGQLWHNDSSSGVSGNQNIRVARIDAWN